MRELVRVWIAGDRLDLRDKRDEANYQLWVRQGFLNVIPGPRILLGPIHEQIDADNDAFNIAQIGYDPWGMKTLEAELEDEGHSLVAVRQGPKTMSDPSKEFEAMVLARELAHGGNPLLRWAVDHCSVEMDKSGNIMPSKKHSTDRIDPVVATIMAIALAALARIPTPTYYDDHEVEFLG